MAVRIDVKVIANIDTKGTCNKIMHNRAFWMYAAQQWHKQYLSYVPMDTGTLANQVQITPGQIEHIAPYARYIYNGERFNFRRDLHPKACAQWDKKAEPTQKPKLISSLQAYINSGRINFNG